MLDRWGNMAGDGHRKPKRGDKWTCTCGQWTWADKPKCHSCGKTRQKAPGKPNGGAKGGGEDVPTVDVEGYVVAVRNKKERRAGARLAKELVELAEFREAAGKGANKVKGATDGEAADGSAEGDEE